MDKLRALTQHPFTRGLDEQTCRELAELGHLRTYHPGHQLLVENQPAEAFYLLLKGHVEVEVHLRGQSYRLETLGPGQAVGWSWALPPHLNAFDIRVVEEGVQALEFPAQPLRQLLDQRPALGYVFMQRLLATLAERYRHTRLQLVDLYGP